MLSLVLIPMITILGIIANLVFLFTVIRLHRMRNSLNAFLGNLAVADILFLSIACMWYLTIYSRSPLLYDMPVTSAFGCVVMNVPFYFGHLASMGFITLISFERFYAVCYPIRHRAIKRQKRTILLVTVTWVVALGIALLFIPSFSKNSTLCVTWPNSDQFEDIPNSYTVCSYNSYHFAVVPELILSITFTIVLMINFFLNGSIICTISVSSRSIESTSNARQINRNTFRKVTLVLAVNTLIYFLFQTPYRIQTIEVIISTLLKKPIMNFETGIGSTLWIVSELCMFLNSAINPLIFAVGSRFYRQGFRDALTIQCKHSRRYSLETHIQPWNDRPCAMSVMEQQL